MGRDGVSGFLRGGLSRSGGICLNCWIDLMDWFSNSILDLRAAFAVGGGGERGGGDWGFEDESAIAVSVVVVASMAVADVGGGGVKLEGCGSRDALLFASDHDPSHSRGFSSPVSHPASNKFHKLQALLLSRSSSDPPQCPQSTGRPPAAAAEKAFTARPHAQETRFEGTPFGFGPGDRT